MSKDKKIGVLCSSASYGGLEINILKLAVWMQERGHNVHFYCAQNTRLYSEANKKGLRVCSIPYPNKYFDLKSARIIASIIKGDDIHHVIIGLSKDIGVIAWVKWFMFFNLKIIYMQCMQLGVNKKDPIHTIRFLHLNHWLSPMQYMIKEVKKRTLYPSQRLLFCPQGIDLNKFTNNSITKEIARKHLSQNQDHFYLGVIGRIDEFKGQHFAIEALEKLKHEFPQIKLIIAGEEPDPREPRKKILSGLAESLGVLESIIFIPFISQPEYFYKALDILIVPSINESYGMVTIEGMASGLPVVGSNSGGTAEIIQHNKTGLLFEQANSEDLSEKLKHLLNNPEHAIILAGNAKSESIERYSYSSQCDLIEQLLR